MWNIFNHLGFETIFVNGLQFCSALRGWWTRTTLGPFLRHLSRWFIISASLFWCQVEKIDTSPIRQKFCHLRVMLQKVLALLRKINPRLGCQQLSSELSIYRNKGSDGSADERGGAHRAQVAFLSNILVPVDCVSSLQTWRHAMLLGRCSRQVYVGVYYIYTFCIHLYVCVSAAAAKSIYVRRETGRKGNKNCAGRQEPLASARTVAKWCDGDDWTLALSERGKPVWIGRCFSKAIIMTLRKCLKVAIRWTKRKPKWRRVLSAGSVFSFYCQKVGTPLKAKKSRGPRWAIKICLNYKTTNTNNNKIYFSISKMFLYN